MLNHCDNSWKDLVFQYIGDDYYKCLYLYINLKKYGFENPNFNIWVSLDENNKIKALLAMYYTGMHIFCKEADYIIDDLKYFINKNQPSIVNATGSIIESLHDNFPGYAVEYGSVGRVKQIPYVNYDEVEKAKVNDMSEISELLINDKGLGGHYNQKLLEEQLKERFIEGYGRNYIIKLNGKIVSHCATYAENNNLAVTSGVYTIPNERGKGLAYKIYSKLCSDLVEEGKEVFAYFYTQQAHKIHEKVGFTVVSSWAKLVKI